MESTPSSTAADSAKGRLAAVARKPWVKRSLITFAVLFVLFGLLGYLVLPGVVKSQAEKIIAEKLQRQASIEKIEISPYTLQATIRGFMIREADGKTPFVSFDELFVDADISSLFRLAPVVKAVRLTKPYVHVVHLEGSRYNFTDIQERLAKEPPSEGESKFAIYNIQLDDGKIEFDDRPENTLHTIDQLKIGLPFFSNFASHVDVFVQPSLAARVNGAQLALTGTSKPYAEPREASLELNLDQLELAKYFEYVPFEPRFKMPSGKLDVHLSAHFLQHKDKSPSIVIKGDTALHALELTEKDGRPLVKLPELSVALTGADVLGGSADIARIAFKAPELDVVREKDGGINLARLAPPPARPAAKSRPAPEEAAPKADTKAAKPAPFKLAIGEIAIEGAKVRFTDEVPAKPFRTTVDKLDVALKQFTLAGDKPAALTLDAHTEAGEALKHQGELTLAPLAAKGRVELSGATLARYLASYVDVLAAEVDSKGTLDAAADYRFEQPAEGAPQFVASEASASLRNLGLRLPSEKVATIQIDSFGIAKTGFDLGKRELVIGELTGKGAKALVIREKDGKLNLARLVKGGDAKPEEKPAPKPAEPKPATAGAAKPGEPPAFAVQVKQVAIEGWSARVEDRTMAQPVVTLIDPLSLTAQDISNVPGSRAKLDLKARVNKKGQIAASGTAGAAPLHANLKLDLKAVDLLPAQPYFTDKVNVLLTSAALSTRGQLALDEAKDGALKGGFKGELNVGDLATVDKTNSADFLKWKSLFFGGVDVKLAPFALNVDQIALSDFYARVIVSQDGRINLQDVVRAKGEEARSVTTAAPAGEKKADEPAAKPADAAPAGLPLGEGAPATAPAATAKPAPAKPADKNAAPGATQSAAAMPPIRIGKVTLQGGLVNFTDNFIKPNYTANLQDLGGSVTGLSSDANSRAEVDLKGQVNAAPLVILGNINPLKGDLAMDLKASVKGMELAPLTPYSGKYVGYGIEKGKLSFDVAYKIENRQLTAENRLVLDQLTFGDKIDSPTATKLPVMLAVALLRDRHGVIDINLPVGGSLDDPQFSVGGIIVKVIVNVITKAVTAPFALLGSMFGGGEELSYVEFDAGRYAVPPGGEEKMKSLAKALADRPALKLEITGHADPETDREGLRRASIDRKVRALKLNDLVKKGESVAPEALTVTPEEYPELLKRAYKDEKFPKPRNAVGLTKDLPVEEMEKLMATNAQVSDDDMVALGNQRAQAVKDWLTKSGNVPAERIFLLAAKTGGEKPKDSKAKGSRVDFSLK